MSGTGTVETPAEGEHALARVRGIEDDGDASKLVFTKGLRAELAERAPGELVLEVELHGLRRERV
jgi:hypothetical protein